MFVTILIGLYTSRVVLNALGVTDYGIYSLVGGIVSMLSFLNVGLAGASQRFISFEIGKGNDGNTNNVFCNAIITHYVLALLVFIIMESIGLWLVNYKLNISPERLVAANWVFQCSIITFAISVTNVPYTACIIAHEKMGQFAYLSIFEVGLKLLIAIIILHTKYDRLIIYSFLLLGIQIIVRVCYMVYCRRKFTEAHFSFKFDKSLFKEMISFAGWGCIGNMGFSLKDQLSNIILNLFFGTTVNAARGIATQVNGIINSFASNFTIAVNPQITQNYSSGNIPRCISLTSTGSKYAFFLMSLITIPFLINVEYVLRIWLGEVPEYTAVFVSIILISSCIYSLTHTISTAILATGNVKWFQSLLAIILLSEIPVAYLLLKLGCKPYVALIPSIFTSFISLVMRIILLHKYVPKFIVWDYLTNTFLRCILIFVVAYLLSNWIHSFFEVNFIGLVITSLISVIIYVTIVIIWGLNQEERNVVLSKIKNR